MIIENRLENIPIVTLVGSTKWPEVWEKYQRILSLAGCIVNTVGLFGHRTGLDMAGPQKRLLDKVYLKKILMSNYIVVLNHDGYIGLSAWDEIFFAMAYLKAIKFIEPLEGATREAFIELYTLQHEHGEISERIPSSKDVECEIYGQTFTFGININRLMTREYAVLAGV